MKIVFVQLGPENPKHLWEGMNRVAELWPNLQLVVIVDDLKNRRRAEKVNSNVEVFWYEKNLTSRSEFPSQTWDLKFRRGFWRYSLERLMALSEYHQLNPTVPLLHLESDILPLPSFPFEAFENLDRLAWPIVRKDHDVAAVLYSPNAQSSLWLVGQIHRRLAVSPEHSDMTVLCSIRLENPASVMVLPSWASPLESSRLTPEHESLHARQYISAFGGIFDGAPIGMWLTGQDPRNHLGFTIRYLEEPESYFVPSSALYRLDANGSLWARGSEAESLIHCLHIHSKYLPLFRSKSWKQTLETMAVESASRVNQRRFSAAAFLYLVRDRRRTLVNRTTFQKFISLVLGRVA